MLQTIRENLQGTMAKVIIAIIIVPFAIFGVESLISIGGTDAAAEVNGEEIHPNELARAVNSQQRRLVASGNTDPAMLDESQLRGPVLNLLIDQRLLLQHAAGLGMSVPDPIVDRVIVAAPEFHENGRFSPERYRVVLANQGFTPGYFKNDIVRREMLIAQLQRGVLLSDFATGVEVDLIAALAGQRRSYDWLVIPAATVAADSIDAAAVQAYYDSNSERFVRPERARFAYIELQARDFAAAVDEAAIRAEYEREVGDAAAAPQREVAHILVEADGDAGRQRAAELRAMIADGRDFAEVAAEHSDDVGSRTDGGYLGATTGEAFPAPFEAAVAALAVGEVSPPVETDAGWHLIKVLSEQQGNAAPFEQRRAEIAERLALAQAQPELLKAVERLRDLTFNADDLAGPAQEVGVEVEQSDWVTRGGDHPLLGLPAVAAIAFGDDVLKEGHNSDAIELAPDRFVFVRALAHEPASPRPLAEVRDEIVQRLAQQQAQVATRAQASDLAARLTQGATIAQLADEQGLQHGRVDDALRNTDGPQPGLTAAVFALPKPTADGVVRDVVELEDGSVALVALQAVQPGRADALSAGEREAWLDQLASAEGQRTLLALLDQLRDSAEITRF